MVSQVMEFPVVMLVRFWANHHLLDLFQRPLWRVVKDRSRSYVNKIVAGAFCIGPLDWWKALERVPNSV